MEFNQKGVTDIYFKRFDEHITFSKPIMNIKNLIIGGLYVDVSG